MPARLKQSARRLLDRIPLWLQVAFFMTALTTLLTFLLVYKDYTSVRRNEIQNRVSVTSHLLSLEMTDLDQYLRDLSTFAILPCYDNSFTMKCEQKTPFTQSDSDYIKAQMASYYYTRHDMRNFSIYFLNQGIQIGRTLVAQHITADVTDFNTDDVYEACEASPYNYCLLPAEDGNSFFTYYHSLIRIKNRATQAIVMLEVDNSYLRRLLANHSDGGEILVFLDENGSLIYSSDYDMLSGDGMDAMLASKSTDRDGITTVQLAGSSYLFTASRSSKYKTSLISLIPLSGIAEQMDTISHSVIYSGVLLWLLTTLALNVLCRLLLGPLNTLARKMELAGGGDFHTTISLGGSREIVELSSSFNSMIHHIDELIKRTYIAELSEKDARITALKAQLNPHFLYNTLQAISTEALINDQPKIHKMVTSLATNLHYTIKGEDLVPLKRELQYVSDYIFLQKIRMDDKLTVQLKLDPAAEEYLVPRISIQPLVENAILHGFRPDASNLQIKVSTRMVDKRLLVCVSDNGPGIAEQQLQDIYRQFRESLLSGKTGGIGLTNLYNRLHLLYQEPAELIIDTRENRYTSITLDLPAVFS